MTSHDNISFDTVTETDKFCNVTVDPWISFANASISAMILENFINGNINTRKMYLDPHPIQILFAILFPLLKIWG